MKEDNDYKEIEVKVIEIDKEKIKDKLISLGAKKIFEGEVISEFYDYKDNNLKLKKSFLRLRQKGDESYITFKKKISKETEKIMEEIESKISDIKAIRNILKNLELNKNKTSKKYRETYKINDTLFEFDKIKDIPLFMEIESPNKEEINKYIKLLNIPKEKVKPWSTKDILKHYKK